MLFIQEGVTRYINDCSENYFSAFHAPAATEIISIFNICLSGNGLTSNSDPAKPPSIEVPALSFDELKEQTDDFGSKTLVGEGSYGRVYYAVLENGKHAAVKKLDASADPEPDNEFHNEFLAQVLCTPQYYKYLNVLNSSTLINCKKVGLQKFFARLF
jgi:hypothetical protein